MTMNYDEALEYIFAIPPVIYPLGNEQLGILLEKLANPQDGLKIIHIAGTNGKGSAASMLCSILKAQGYKTGLFTSPFIQRFNERIRIGDEEIPDERLAECVRKVKNAGVRVSQFAFILACAFVYYREEKCDFVILEAGLGGRLDATNVIRESFVSVIMSIGLDHTQYLGSTIEEIAAEKCGIIKENGIVAAYRNTNGAEKIIEDTCKRRNARLVTAKKAYKTDGGFCCGGREYRLALGGDYQAENAAAVLAAVEAMRIRGCEISEEALREGFENCRWKARFEFVRPNIIVDGGHNPDGMAALCESLDKIDARKTAIVAMMKDKATGKCLERLSKSVQRIIVTELDMPRCEKCRYLAKEAEKYCRDVVFEENLNNAFRMAENEEGLFVICGSLFLAGKALDYFKSE